MTRGGAVLTLASTALVAFAALLGAGCERREPSHDPDVRPTHDKSPGHVEHATPAAARFAAGADSYARYCALCHAADGSGYAADNAPSLVSRTFLESATNDFIAKSIREGRPGTAMSGYAKARGGPLDDDEIASIIGFLRTSAGTPAAAKLPSLVGIGDVASGEHVYQANCQRCHGTRTDRGTAVHLANPMFLGAASDSFLRHAIVNGRPGTPMPSFDGVLPENHIDDVVAYVRSLATPAPAPRQPPPEIPKGPAVIHPKGKDPEFTLRADRFVPIDAVKTALEQGKRMVIIDARAVPDWVSMHIPGSISVPYYGFARLDELPKDGTWILAYCACPHHASGVVVDELRKRRFPHTAILDEGILEWKKRSYPTESYQAPDAGSP